MGPMNDHVRHLAHKRTRAFEHAACKLAGFVVEPGKRLSLFAHDRDMLDLLKRCTCDCAPSLEQTIDMGIDPDGDGLASGIRESPATGLMVPTAITIKCK